MTGYLEKEIKRVDLSGLGMTEMENVQKHLDWGSGKFCPISSSHDEMTLQHTRYPGSYVGGLPEECFSTVLKCSTCGWETTSVPEEMTKW